MSDMTNPYQSPEASSKEEAPLVFHGGLTETMIMYLKGASPWLRFIGIMGFIGSGGMVLSGIVCLIFMPLMGNFFSGFSDAFDSVLGSSTLLMFIYSFYLIGVGALVFFPALFTYRFGAKIRAFYLSGSEPELELAFKNNKSLWKFQGIVMIIALAFIPVMIIGIIAAAALVAIR